MGVFKHSNLLKASKKQFLVVFDHVTDVLADLAKLDVVLEAGSPVAAVDRTGEAEDEAKLGSVRGHLE